MAFVIDNLPEAIRNTKQQLRAALPEYKEIFREVETEMQRRVEEIVSEREAGLDVIPVAQYAEIASGKVSAGLITRIKARGACVVRGTFSKEQATGWDDEIAAYVEQYHRSNGTGPLPTRNYRGSPQAHDGSSFDLSKSTNPSLVRERAETANAGFPVPRFSKSCDPEPQ